MMQRGSLWATLALTLFACWWVGQADQAPSPAAKTGSSPAKARQQMPLSQVMPALKAPMALPEQSNASVNTLIPANATIDESLDEAIQAIVDQPIVNLFAALPAPVAQADDLAVEAPVNPYTYAGRLLQQGQWLVFLTDGQQQYVVREGDFFAEGWRLVRLDQHRIVLQHAAERFEMMLENGGVF